MTDRAKPGECYVCNRSLREPETANNGAKCTTCNDTGHVHEVLETTHYGTPCRWASPINCNRLVSCSEARLPKVRLYGDIPPEDDRIRPEIKALIARGNVTPAELAELRMNSWERDAIVPALTDEALVERFEYALANCFTGARPFSTYNQAVEGLYAPELIRRFKNIALRASAVDDFLEAIDGHGGYKEQIGWLREALEPFVRDGDTFITGDMSSGEECVHADSEDVKRAIAVLSVTSPPATAGDAEDLSAGDPGVAGGDSKL